MPFPITEDPMSTMSPTARTVLSTPAHSPRAATARTSVRGTLAAVRALTFAVIVAAGALLTEGIDRPVEAQIQEIPESMRARTPPRQKLSGPRFGMTAFTGQVAELRDRAGHGPFMSQFGWQFENQIVSTETGNQALMEFVLLFGGFEQEMRNLSLSWLAGYRLPNGFELGVGPNFGIQLNSDGGTTTSMVTAVGATMPFGGIYVPANVAVAWGRGGPRITTLIGWIIGG
jgi:hypothetical protein